MKRSTMLGAMLLCACGQSGLGRAGVHRHRSRLECRGAGRPCRPRARISRLDGRGDREPGAPGTDSHSGNSTARETNASPGQVAAFYREHFRKAGIPVRADTANAQGGLISVARDGKHGARVPISRRGDKTRIAVMTGPR